jgi:SP family general alpha glucoside:H+ symporter-like MFS transporter
MSPRHGEHLEVHVDDEQFRKMSIVNPNIASIAEDAAKAAEAEQSQTLWQGLKLYRKAAGWSILLSCAIIMEGFDIVLIANLLAVPAFKRRFGQQLPDGSYDLTAAWQSGLTNGAYVGEILGLMINGWIADRIGFKKTMIGALSLVCGLIFIVFFVQSIEMLLVGLILMGIPWGVFQTLTTTVSVNFGQVVVHSELNHKQ